jgi:hypothetical protein
MREDVRADLGRSAADFLNVVWPRIRCWFGGGELVPVETTAPAPFVKQLDTLAGIDAWHVHMLHGIRGIASRVQWVGHDPAWATFTVRSYRNSEAGAETELAKRLRAIKGGRSFLYPALTVQAYLDVEGGTLLYACSMYSTLLYGHIDQGRDRHDWYLQTCKKDGNVFVVVPVDVLKREGLWVKEYVLSESRLRRIRLPPRPSGSDGPAYQSPPPASPDLSRHDVKPPPDLFSWQDEG